MVDGSHSQFKATLGRKEDRDFKKKGRFDKKNHEFGASDPKVFPSDKEFTKEQIESTKKRMREILKEDKRGELIVLLATLTAIVLSILLWIL